MHVQFERLFFDSTERRFAEAIARVAYENPFLPARIEHERAALGGEFRETQPVWSADRAHVGSASFYPERPNVARLRDLSWKAARRARERIVDQKGTLDERDLALYEDLALYALFARYELALYELAVKTSLEQQRFGAYARFKQEFEELLSEPGLPFPSGLTAKTAIAFFFQIRRAFHYVFRYLLGSSKPISALRAETWHSIFTHDLRRYQRGVHLRMSDIPTLIVGPSGTGKDLVAQAIGYCRHLAFDEDKQRFVEPFASQYHALNVSALSVGLIESELFGHRRGAFTGALEDRQGWLETCGPDGTVFLDEIGELGTELQVKFLRVLQSRTFQRIGETKPRMFLGKIAVATHRDLDRGLDEGWFREDLYYRLCADRIETPSLRERLDDDPNELDLLVGILADRIAGEANAASLKKDALDWIERELDPRYAWRGNVRELEQCVRNVLVRKRYRPPRREATKTLDRALVDSGLSAEELLDRYCASVYEGTGSYVETGRRLGLDRRTVKERVERAAKG